MLFHVHEQSKGAHPLEPQKEGVDWWIKHRGESTSWRLQISDMGIDAASAEECWLMYGHDDILLRTNMFRFLFFMKRTPPPQGRAHLLSGGAARRGRPTPTFPPTCPPRGTQRPLCRTTLPASLSSGDQDSRG